MSEKSTDELAKILWDYNLMHQKLEKADVILALGSHDTQIAEYSAQLFFEGWAPLIIFSGGVGRLTEKWSKPEAEIFAEIAISLGIPKDKIILESKSTNTGENIRFTRALIEEKGLNLDKFILVQKPYMERRSYATFKKEMPNKVVVVTSPPVTYDTYYVGGDSKEKLINVLVGDTQRIKLYGEKGFMVPQEMPSEVWKAYEELVSRGYTQHLVK